MRKNWTQVTDNFDFIKMKEKNCVCYLSLKAESHATFSK